MLELEQAYSTDRAATVLRKNARKSGLVPPFVLRYLLASLLFLY
jgi:hypothetical protein